MKNCLSWVWVAGLVAVSASAATSPIYINNGPVYVPPDILPNIDARAFVNNSIFNINSSSIIVGGGDGSVIIGGTLPYETKNTLFYTNNPSGTMSGSPGFRFINTDGSFRYWANTFNNRGSIDAGTYLYVQATNIISTGPLDTSAQGLIHLEGKNVELSRNGLRAGNAPGIFFGGGRNLTSPSNSYINAVGVTDVYWGVGTNNYLGGNNNAMPLNPFAGTPNFNLPFPRSPYHQVIEQFSGFTYTNLVSLPWFSFFGFGAFVYTNQTSPSNFTIQVVFVATNNLDTNFTTDVRFSPFNGANGGAAAVVEFKATDYDIVKNTFNTNKVYLIDTTPFVTNVSLFRNLNVNNSRRPGTIELVRSEFDAFEWQTGVPGNAVFTNGLLDTGYVLNAVTNRYVAYEASITSVAATNFGFAGTGLGDPTNFPGRVEIVGDNLNLDFARIRAESTVLIRTGNLSSNKVARVDAPYAIFDLASRQPEMVISNLAPSDVRRISGTIACWSGTWLNYQVDPQTNTNTFQIHVLIVDNNLQSLQPVTLWELSLRGTNITVHDQLFASHKFRLDAKGLDVKGGLSLPTGSSWGNTNVLNLVHFTNHGVITIDGAGNYGTDRPTPYSEFVNYGTNTAAAQLIRSSLFENRGVLRANAGVLTVDSLTNRMFGGPTILVTNVFTNYFIDFNGMFVTNVFTNAVTNAIGALLESNSDIDLRARDMSVSNSVLAAGIVSPGVLRLCVTNSLMDAGPAALNDWRASRGFETTRLPTTSSLMGTWLRSSAALNVIADHFWAGTNRGVNVSGFSNNLALGKLILDGADNSLFRFFGRFPNSAMYVDYIEFVGTATNYSNPFYLSIDPGFTIYFANANVAAEKLDGALGGRFRWVRGFTGPLSSTNLTYSSGRTYTFNIALVGSKNIDSDGDGVVNADDPEPIYTGDNLELSIALTSVPPRQALLSWDGLAGSTNVVEYKTSLLAPNWLVLTNVVVGPANEVIIVRDPGSLSSERYYRVRLLAPPL